MIWKIALAIWLTIFFFTGGSLLFTDPAAFLKWVVEDFGESGFQFLVFIFMIAAIYTESRRENSTSVPYRRRSPWNEGEPGIDMSTYTYSDQHWGAYDPDR